MVMTIDRVLQVVRDGVGVGATAELRAELERGAASHTTAGETSARDAAATWQCRQWTTERAGADTAGFADAVRALGAEPEDARVGLFHFQAPGKVFVVFVADDRVLGCLRLNRTSHP